MRIESFTKLERIEMCNIIDKSLFISRWFIAIRDS